MQEQPRTPEIDARCQSAPAERNRAPILEVLQRVLPPQGVALEIASGTGQHAVHFAAGLPGWTWHPSDPSTNSLASIAAWARDAALPNLQEPVKLDVLVEPWPVQGPFDAIFCANMLHISPWATCPALMRNAARLLAPGGLLVTYGPYFVREEAVSPGNESFDADLRARNPDWGIRWLHDVQAQAESVGLSLEERVLMPANNLTLVFRRGR
jgi:SAM-dependent methyltransferase